MVLLPHSNVEGNFSVQLIVDDRVLNNLKSVIVTQDAMKENMTKPQQKPVTLLCFLLPGY
jgi:hypothetical protein